MIAAGVGVAGVDGWAVAVVTTIAREADTGADLPGAADLRLGIAPRNAGVTCMTADLTGVIAVAVIAAVAGNGQIDARAIAKFVGRRQSASPAVRPAAELFAIAGAVATGVIATGGIARVARSGELIVTARRTANGIALREVRGAAAHVANRDLVARTCDRLGRWRWSPGRFGRTLQQRAAHRRRAPEPKQPLEHGATTGAAGERLDQ